MGGPHQPFLSPFAYRSSRSWCVDPAHYYIVDHMNKCSETDKRTDSSTWFKLEFGSNRKNIKRLLQKNMNILQRSTDDMVNPVHDGSVHAPTPCHGRNADVWGPHTHENAPRPLAGVTCNRYTVGETPPTVESGAHLRATWRALVRPSRHRDRKGTV